MRNPYTPTFGVTPPLLVGRDETIVNFREALEDGVGAPARAMLITGTRGSGKTVLLNALEDVALEKGWAVISVTTRPGIAQELVDSIFPRFLDQYVPAKYGNIKQIQATVLGVGGGITKNDPHRIQDSLRTQLFELSDAMSRQGAGVLISIDEVHRSAVEDLRQITQEIQHAFRQGKEVALIAAGLPETVSDLLSDDVLTFLRRAERVNLGPVPLPDIEQALEVPAQQHEKMFEADALAYASQGTKGYPFLIQSIGYELWRVAGSSKSITSQHASEGVRRATLRIGALVHEPALNSLSDIDKSFLAAMARDSGPSKMSSIVERLGISPQYANTYRTRLLEHEIIYSPRYGHVDFTIPYLREYLQEHVASEHF